MQQSLAVSNIFAYDDKTCSQNNYYHRTCMRIHFKNVRSHAIRCTLLSVDGRSIIDGQNTKDRSDVDLNARLVCRLGVTCIMSNHELNGKLPVPPLCLWHYSTLSSAWFMFSYRGYIGCIWCCFSFLTLF